MSVYPLEADSEVLTKYIHSLGVSNSIILDEVFSLDHEDLQFIPQPILSLILTYNISSTDLSFDGKICDDQSVYFLTQNVRNSCGTVALIHALANSCFESHHFEEYSPLASFIARTRSMNKDERGTELENDFVIQNIHNNSAVSSNTDIIDDTCFHFVSFVNVNGQILLFDGRLKGPVSLKKTTEDAFLFDCVKIIRDVIEKNPDSPISLQALSFH